MIDFISSFVKEFFDKFTIELDKIEISNKNDIYLIFIETKYSELLIGPNGITFESIEYLFKRFFFNKFGEKLKIKLKINNYIHDRNKILFNIVDRGISRVKKTGSDVKLPRFSAYERKKIHDYVSSLNEENVGTESRGQGIQRRLYITFIKRMKLDIDIDGTDI